MFSTLFYSITILSFTKTFHVVAKNFSKLSAVDLLYVGKGLFTLMQQTTLTKSRQSYGQSQLIIELVATCSTKMSNFSMRHNIFKSHLLQIIKIGGKGLGNVLYIS